MIGYSILLAKLAKIVLTGALTITLAQYSAATPEPRMWNTASNVSRNSAFRFICLQTTKEMVSASWEIKKKGDFHPLTPWELQHFVRSQQWLWLLSFAL